MSRWSHRQVGGDDRGLSIVEVEVDRLRQTLRRCAAQQPAHQVGRHPSLPEPGDEEPEHMDVLGDEAHEVDEQGEVAHRQSTRLPNSVGREQQHQAGAEVDRVPEERIQPLLEDPVAHHDLLACLVEPAQMADHPVLGTRQLDRLDRRRRSRRWRR